MKNFGIPGLKEMEAPEWQQAKLSLPNFLLLILMGLSMLFLIVVLGAYESIARRRHRLTDRPGALKITHRRNAVLSDSFHR